MTDSYETPHGPGADAPEAEVASGAGAASRAGAFGVAGEQIDATVADADADEVIDGEVVDPLAAVTAQRDEYLDSLRRLQAEFENYRKRVAKQQTEQAERATVSLVDKLLPVLDALDLAAAHSGNAESDDARALVAASSLHNDVLAEDVEQRVDPHGPQLHHDRHQPRRHLPVPAKPHADHDNAEAN